MKQLAKIKNLAFICLSFTLPLVAPYIDFLRFNHYGYFRSDALVLASLLIVIGIGFGIIFKIGSWLVKLLVFAFLVTLSISYFPEVQSIGALLCVFFGSAFIFMLLSQYAIELLLIFFGVLTLGNLFLPMKIQLYSPSIQTHVTPKPLANLPPIIYLILDEQEGIDGFPQDLPHVSEFKTKFAGFFKANGFKVYDAAFSHYPATYNSIPNALNFTTSNINSYYFADENDLTLLHSALFSMLAQKGYQFHIYQSDFLNYCSVSGVNISSCYTYPAQSLNLIQDVPLSLFEKTKFLLKSFLLQSAFFMQILHLYQDDLISYLTQDGWYVREWPWYQASVSSIEQPEVIEKIKEDVMSHPNGNVFFAHLLFPHDPFLYDADCHIRPEPDTWKLIYGPVPQDNTPQLRALRYSYYFEQDACAQKQLDALFSALQKAGIYQNAIIIIHGDHGSRIALDWPNIFFKNQLSQQDFRDYFLTLYASKIPGQAAGYDNEMVDLQNLLAMDVGKIMGRNVNVSHKDLFVYLDPITKGDLLIHYDISNFR